MGMETGSIADSAISASSMRDINHAPWLGRLHTVAKNGKRGGWSAKRFDKNQWFQVDLGSVREVTKIATQGRQDYSQWVKQFKLAYSLNGTTFQTYLGNKVNTN